MAARDLRAVVLGATGLVGAEVVRLLLADARFAGVAVLVRRPTGVAHPKLAEHVVSFDAPDAWAPLVRGDVLLSALGTTLRAAGSQGAQYRVDHGYQHAAARAARANGVPACVLVSSAGASPRSRIFYSRMKGELERDVEALGFERTRILRPGMLDGDRREHRAGERLALAALRPLAPVLPAPLRPIHASIVARDQACVDLIYQLPADQRRAIAERIESRLGLHQLEYMDTLGMGSREYNLIEI